MARVAFAFCLLGVVGALGKAADGAANSTADVSEEAAPDSGAAAAATDSNATRAARETAVADSAGNSTAGSEPGLEAPEETVAGNVELAPIDDSEPGATSLEGSFSFGPRPPKPTNLQVTVKNTSFGRFFEEILRNRTVPGKVEIVRSRVGTIHSGFLDDLAISGAALDQGAQLAGATEADFDVVVPDLKLNLRARYDVVLTRLRIGDQGRMNLTLSGGGVRLRFPNSGEGTGKCIFDPSMRLKILETRPDQIAGNSVQDAWQNVVAVVNNNMLSLQYQLLHTVEKYVCASLLANVPSEWASFRDDPGRQETDLQAFLSSFGITEMEFYAGMALCMLGCCLGCVLQCCCCPPSSRGCCCFPGRQDSRSTEVMPLKMAEEGQAGYTAYPQGGSFLSSLACCRRSPSAIVMRHDGM